MKVISYANKEFHCQEPMEIGYRCHYPYLDVKFYCQDNTLLQRAIKCLKQYYGKLIVSEKGLKASERLLNYLRCNPTRMSFVDRATGGLLQHTLARPGNGDRLHWDALTPAAQYDVRVQVTGMDGYWSGADALNTELSCSIEVGNKEKACLHKIRVRGATTLVAAVEWVCLDVLQCIESSST